ncbi:unnamed protein product [Brassica rapa subsp. trilocularis]
MVKGLNRSQEKGRRSPKYTESHKYVQVKDGKPKVCLDAKLSKMNYLCFSILSGYRRMSLDVGYVRARQPLVENRSQRTNSPPPPPPLFMSGKS